MSYHSSSFQRAENNLYLITYCKEKNHCKGKTGSQREQTSSSTIVVAKCEFLRVTIKANLIHISQNGNINKVSHANWIQHLMTWNEHTKQSTTKANNVKAFSGKTFKSTSKPPAPRVYR